MNNQQPTDEEELPNPDENIRKKRGVSIFTMLVVAAVCSLLTFAITLYGFQKNINENFAGIAAKVTKFEKLYKLDNFARANFAYEIDEEKLMDGVLAGYVAGLDDPYTYYLTKDQYQKASMEMGGKFVGIGIKVAYDDETKLIRVTLPMKNSPAEEAGILAGDLIVTAEGEDVLELGYNGAVLKLLGEADTEAHFTVLREGVAEPIEFSVIRKAFDTETVSYKMMPDGLGYIQIYEFDTSTLNQFKVALNDLTAQNAKGIIFDVRNNPGGELNTICSILDMLVPEGPIIEIVGKGGKVVETRKSKPSELNLPMAVLINNQTYSAAELFAATLRDYEKATLVGETTFGKGTMQTLAPLEDGSAINLTINKYNPPNGVNYHDIGVAPHVEVILSKELKAKAAYLTPGEDVQLQKAIEVLIEKISK